MSNPHPYTLYYNQTLQQIRDVYEYYYYLKEDVFKHNCKAPEWLKINTQPFMSLKDIDKKVLNISDYNGLEFSLNVKNKNEVYKN